MQEEKYKATEQCFLRSGLERTTNFAQGVSVCGKKERKKKASASSEMNIL